MRQSFVLLLIAAISCLCSPASSAQATRPLKVWVDTLTRNVCDDKSFTIQLRVGSYRQGDTATGFRTLDTVNGGTLYVQWDPTTIDLDGIVLTSGTLAAQTKVSVTKLPDDFTLQIILGDPDFANHIIAGKLPLLTLVGTVKAPDTVTDFSGWIRPSSIDLTSSAKFQPTYVAGFVHVIRDTTAAYTGHLAVSPATFDTLRFDTISVLLQNVRMKHVKRVDVTLMADTAYYHFQDTIQQGTLAGTLNWSAKTAQIMGDTLHASFTAAGSEITQDGTLFKVILARTSDSAFTGQLRVADFRVNEQSCLGRVTATNAPVTAARIEEKDTEITAVPDLKESEREIQIIQHSAERILVIQTGTLRVEEVRIYDIMGRIVGSATEDIHEGYARVKTYYPLSPGSYFIALRSRNVLVSKQFLSIQ